MPRQYYLTADEAIFDPGMWRGSWDIHSSDVYQLDSTKTTFDPDKYVIQAKGGTEGTWELNVPEGRIGYRVGLLQFVSGPMRAQFIKGTIDAMIGIQDAGETESAYFAMHVWATQGDTSDLRVTLVDNFKDELTNPWPSEAKGRPFAKSAAINANYINNGDHIVVELGFIARNLDDANAAGFIFFGTDFYSNGSPDMQYDI